MPYLPDLCPIEDFRSRLRKRNPLSLQSNLLHTFCYQIFHGVLTSRRKYRHSYKVSHVAMNSLFFVRLARNFVNLKRIDETPT
jgi:hypothetical protein